MRIKQLLSQHRRDFRALYECEFCGDIRQGSGYDDTNFHANVVPSMKCDSCGKSADLEVFRPFTTKYPDGEQV